MHSIAPEPGTKLSTELGYFLILLAITLLLYRNLLGIGFISDDFSIIGKFIESGEAHLQFSNYFRPLGLGSLWLDLQLFGINPFWYRLENIVWHSANGWLTYYLCGQLLGKKHDALNRMAGLLFILLPAHSEVLAWISCRFDLLATFFSLLCLVSYLHWIDSGKKRWLLIYTLALPAAFLSKESAFCLPFLLIIICLLKQSPAQLWSRQSRHLAIFFPSIAVLTAQFVWRHQAIGTILGGGNYPPMTIISYGQHLTAYFFRTALFPLEDFHLRELLQWREPYILLSFLLLLLIAWLTADNIQKKFIILIPVAYVLSLSPVLHSKIDLFLIGSERYVYLPSIWFCIFLALLVQHPVLIKLRYLVLIPYIFMCLWALPDSIQRWQAADRIIKKSMQDIQDIATSKPVLVLGLPTAYKGAYIFQNGFPRALHYFYKTHKASSPPRFPLTIEVNEEHVPLQISRLVDGYEVKLDSAISRLEIGQDSKRLDIAVISDNRYTVRSGDLFNGPYHVLAYCNEGLALAGKCP